MRHSETFSVYYKQQIWLRTVYPTLKGHPVYNKINKCMNSITSQLHNIYIFKNICTKTNKLHYNFIYTNIGLEESNK